MEVYVLDSLLRRTGMAIDKFESLIWTERWSAYGDFELVLLSTYENRSVLVENTRLVINDSFRVMTIETVTKKIDTEGRNLLTVTGRSIEAILEDRVGKNTFSNTTLEPKWIMTGTPGTIARDMFKASCIAGTLNASDKIPFIQVGASPMFALSNIAESNDVITLALDLDTVYSLIQNICDVYDLGFRLVRNFEQSQLYFDIYSGSDRTTSQQRLPPVIFGQEFDNLSDVSELTSIAQYKNVAYVFCPFGTETVYAANIDPTISGFERRIILVDASGVTEETYSSDLLIQLGSDELAKNRAVSVLDGELSKTSVYKYGTDYNLGDVVEMRNTDGVINRMRVTEHIFVSNKEGESSYPTLAIDLFVMPGTWFDWKYNQTWDDAEGYWDEQL